MKDFAGTWTIQPLTPKDLQPAPAADSASHGKQQGRHTCPDDNSSAYCCLLVCRELLACCSLALFADYGLGRVEMIISKLKLTKSCMVLLCNVQWVPICSHDQDQICVKSQDRTGCSTSRHLPCACHATLLTRSCAFQTIASVDLDKRVI